MKLRHFVQKLKKNTLKYGLDAKKDTKRDAKSSFCYSDNFCKVINEPPQKINFPNKIPNLPFIFGNTNLQDSLNMVGSILIPKIDTK